MNQEEFSRKLQSPPPELAQLVEDCMSDQEFLIHINALIPSTSEEANSNLLDFANSFWIELKEDLYHTFSFVAHHFTPEVLQGVYDLSGDANGGMLPWGLIGAAIYLQTNTPVREINEDAWDHFTVFSTPETPDTLSALAICTVRENGCATRFYTGHFGQFDPLKLLYRATALAIHGGSTVTKAIQQIDCHMRASGLGSARAVSGPESKMTNKLFQLMGSSPIVAAHITIDADSGNVVTEMNPLWEKLRDELKPDPFVQRKSAEKKRSFSRKHQPYLICSLISMTGKPTFCKRRGHFILSFILLSGYAVSHELKTPVTIIKGQLEGMLPDFLTAISRKLMNRAILVLSSGADANIYVCT